MQVQEVKCTLMRTYIYTHIVMNMVSKYTNLNLNYVGSYFSSVRFLLTARKFRDATRCVDLDSASTFVPPSPTELGTPCSHMSHSLNSLKGGSYRGLYRELL